MKKGLYLIFSELNQREPDGIEKKMISQCQLFRDIGIDMNFERLEYRYGTDWNFKDKYCDVDFIYFRKETIVDWRMISFLRKLRRNKNIIIFMEIPTFPYEGEFGKSIRSIVSLRIDRYFRNKLTSLIDRIIVTGANVGDYLWGIKTICIVNGINLNNIPIRQYQPHGNILNLTCVAKFSPWHGYERLIKGLYHYYNCPNPRPVKLLMIGDGVETCFYKKLVETYKLEQHVSFLGKLTGDKLDYYYNLTDLGICSLGRYKSGIDIIGDLKSRDLMAKGIPMICGCRIDILENTDYKYVYYVPNDSSEIKIIDLIRFYDTISKDKSFELITQEIRYKAESLIDFSITYKEVLSSVQMLLCKQ